MKNQTFFAASLDDAIPTIDLHQTDNIPDALILLEKELYHIFKQGHKYCRIVHGIGEGKMTQAVHRSLVKNPMIRDLKKEENGGSTIALF